jgi:hypothetical protein
MCRSDREQCVQDIRAATAVESVDREPSVALCELILSAPIYSARGFGRCTFISRTLLYQIDNHVMMMMTSVQRPAAASSFVAKSTKSVRRVSRVVRAASVAAVRI